MTAEGLKIADPQAEIQRLHQRLAEAEEIIQAIHRGQADAVVVAGPEGEKVYLLKDADRPYRIFVEEMQQGAATLGTDGLVYFCNRRLAEMLRVPAERLRGTLIQTYVAPDSQSALQTVLEQGRAGRCEAEIRVNAGDAALDVYLTANPLPAEEEAALSLIVTDLTEQKQRERLVAHERQLLAFNEALEQRVAERTAVVERQAAQLRRLAADLTDTEQRERRRLAQILHDHLQQMLAAARMRLSQLIRRAVDPQQREGMDWLNNLLGECIEQSRSLTAELSPPVLYDVGLSAALDMLARQMQQKYELAVRVETDGQVDPIDENLRVLLFQVVRELLFNAYKHAQTGEVCVRLAGAGDRVRLTVSDDGVGFDTALLDGEATASTSFGLFSIRERMKLMGGSVEVDSAPSKGTRIVITAPRCHDVAVAKEAGHQVSPGLPQPQPSPPGVACRHGRAPIRVLVADDHKILREGLAGMLREEKDMEIVGEAGDGHEAVEMALAMRPDVILMDVTMPRLSGIEATRRIMAELPEVRVIGLSMHDDREVIEHMSQAGAVSYIAKSGTSSELADAIRTHAGKPPR